MRLVTAATMRRMDRRAIEERGIPGIELMERAGAAAAEVAATMLGNPPREALVLCGKGNNGGDGFVIARLLASRGYGVTLRCRVDPSVIVGDAALALAAWRAIGGAVLGPECGGLADGLARADLVVDALLGTGLAGEVGEAYREWIDEVNASGRRVLAIDMPSGLSADTGRVLGGAIRADVTVTFAAAKLGLAQYPGVELAGRVVVADIGIPEDLLPADTPELLTGECVAAMLPRRSADAHKGDAGRVLVVAGSPGLTGAACLTARACCRSGAGLVTVATSRDAAASIEHRLLEAMTARIGGGDPILTEAALPELLSLADRVGALALGPGLGRHEATFELVRGLVAESRCPLVLDADGLLAIVEGGLGGGRGASTVLTPHPGEMACLLGTTVAEVQSDRPAAAYAAARRYGATVVLKGARTLIAAPDGRLAVNPTGHRGMASGGMGDVLTGVVAALLAQGSAEWDAACAGAYLHGLAGERAAERVGGEVGVIAGDLLECLPAARAELSRA